MRIAALALSTGLGLLGTAMAAEPDTYIFDVLALQPYKGNFARLVKADGLPDWVKAISVQGAGTAGPARTVDVAGTPYRLDRVCKVGACATDRIDVLWAPRGAKVWAALVADGKPPAMLGSPKGAQEKALEAAASGGAAPTSVAATPAAPPTAIPAPASAAAAPPAPVPASAGVPAVAPSAGGEPDTYIFDVLASQPYKGSFARLVKAGVPGWVKAISAQGAGTAGPAKTVDVAGMPYRLDRVCKVGACATDTVDVLWAPRGAKAWAALVERGKPAVMLGAPPEPQAKALAEAAARR